MTQKFDMPPRRARKVGLKRLDAALDALRPMGFNPPLIRKTVRNLLKAYGGDEGWPFIEENSYKLLIDTILEEPERDNDGPVSPENTERKSLFENDGSKDDMTEDKCGAQVHSPRDNGSKQVQSPSAESPPHKKLATDVHSPSRSSTLVANSVLYSSSNAETSQFKFERKLPSSQNSAGTSSSQLLSPPAVESRTAQRRKPCYGWLSSDDEEDHDPVKVVPATSHLPRSC